jgi:hypothetical protein
MACCVEVLLTAYHIAILYYLMVFKYILYA